MPDQVHKTGRTRAVRFASILCLILCIPFAAGAEVARVTGGEHADFTRLVIEAREMGAWRFGRTEDGYELAPGPAVTSFDVSKAFDKIPRDRIIALWRDPDSGRLRFSLACACYALAFEFRAGIVVIDIKKGQPPADSAFELSLDTAAPSETGTAPDGSGGDVARADPAQQYDWLQILREGATEDDPKDTQPAAAELPLPTGDVSLSPLTEALLEQISRGAAEGVVEVTGEGPLPSKAGAAVADGPWSRIAVGEMPGLRAGADRDLSGTLTADGASCIPDDKLAVASWGLSGPIAEQIGLGRSGMLGEFDAPLPDAILRAARLHVFLGFGAEARQYLDFLGGDRREEAAMLRSMARIVDGEPDSEPAFAGMESCDTAAALWATLGDAGGKIRPGTNADAVARSFSALPLTLRRQLGGPLVDRFLAAGDEETARRLRDAVLRDPAEADAQTELMDARYHLAEGDETAAQELASGVMQEAGPSTAAAAVTLVEAAFQGNRQIDPQLPSAIDAFLHEASGTEEEAGLARALVLARAMTGDYRGALDVLDRSPASFTDFWRLAADSISEDLFLEASARFAFDRPRTDQQVAEKIAERLVDLGFPDLALGWLGPLDQRASEETRLLAARALMQLGNAPEVLHLLDGLETEGAAQLRARATLQLGQTEAGARALIDAGDPATGERALTWTGDWSVVESEGPEAWRKAAELVTPPADNAGAEGGPIARGNALVSGSEAARQTIEDLLGALVESVPTQ